MRLADFILANREEILGEWVAFARTCSPASTAMDVEGLRDHASEMLTVIAKDLSTPQNPKEQSDKATGKGPDDGRAGDTAAEVHGAGRAESGFTVEQMVAEYRALRASVIRLWTKAVGELGQAHIEDLTRFNEAIDQALAESVSRYNMDLDHAKEVFLAILGHDLRTPLGAIYTSATFLLETQELREPALTLTSRIAQSAKRTVRMVGDLLDFTRSRLGGGIPIERAEASIGKVVHDVVDELAAADPERKFDVETRGEERGEWDCERITQALSNVISNAVQHGAQSGVVKVRVDGTAEDVLISVHNFGSSIPQERLNAIFNPLKSRGKMMEASAGGPQGSLGLGLYIAEQIVRAHHGAIRVSSSEAEGTTFTVCLPRRPPASAA